MDDSTVMSTEAIFVYYSLLLFRVGIYSGKLLAPGAKLLRNL